MTKCFSPILLVVLILVAGCAGAALSPTPVPPSVIPVPATATLVPSTATLVPPTTTPKPIATATLVSPLSGSGGGRIVFASKRDDNYEIYVMPAHGPQAQVNADGTDQRRLTNNPREDGRPAWSPDCRQIAFASDRSGHFDIYVMLAPGPQAQVNADGSNVRRLTTKGDNSYPAWSPAPPGGGAGGAQITFSRYDPGSDLYVMPAPGPQAQVNADGSAARRLTQTPADKGFLTWSPDGKQIAFESNPGGNWDIYVVDLQGSNLRRLTDHPAEDYIPVWSPDGSRIAFESERDRNWEIYVMQADGTDQRRLTRHIAHDGFPSWSPDSKKIAFMSDRDGNPEIYVMPAPGPQAQVNADGSNLQRLTDNAGDDTDPDWSPDGTRIVFVSNRDGNDELYLMPAPGPQAQVNADGGDPRRLTYEKANDWQPAWRPALPRK